MSDQEEGQHPKAKRLRALIASGSEIAGQSVATALGLLAGPPGAFVGILADVAIRRSLESAGEDLEQRVLAPRERMRVGAAAAFAIRQRR